MVLYPFMLGVIGSLIWVDLHATDRINCGCPRTGLGVMSVLVGARVVMVGVHASSHDDDNGLTSIDVSVRLTGEVGVVSR
jgi:hypothetical protein